MSNRSGLLDRTFIFLLAALAGIALSLFVMFNFLPLSQLDEPIALLGLIVTSILLSLGYVLGFVALAFVGLFFLSEMMKRSKK